MGIFAILFFVFILLGVLLRYLNNQTKVQFESKGIPYMGNGLVRILINALQGGGILEDVQKQYKALKAKNIKVAGSNDFGMTTLMITDPDMLRSIFVKDFAHFADRRDFLISKKDYLFGKMLISLRGEKWKALRTKLSPTFTSGKIKRLFSLFDQSGKKLVKYIERHVDESETKEIDLVEAYSKFTMDIIASAVCGIDSQAFDQKEPSLFERMGAALQLNFGAKQTLKLIVMIMAPSLSNFLGFSLFEQEPQDFLSSAIKSSIKQRTDKNEKRNDFLQLMLEAREDKLKTEESELNAFEKDAILKEDQNSSVNVRDDLLDSDGIVANAILFLLAGYDTTQSLLLFCAYALAFNQDIQDKLRVEVETVLEDNDGEFNYDAMSGMTFLDMVIDETLRFYPPAGVTDRGCTMDWKVPGTDFILKKGQGVVIPTFGLHHDPEYFPEPEKFIPERFSPENRGKINQYTYLAFGSGPRNCIGMRFALAEVKVAISHLIHSFRIEPSPKTLIPMKFSKASSLKPAGGMFLALHKIQH